MFRRIKERISLFTVKQPSLTILIAIFVLNLVLFAVAAGIISWLAPNSLVHSGFWASVFIQFVWCSMPAVLNTS